MTPTEVKIYVDAAGGVDAFAGLIRIKPRYVYMLLAGDRKMSGRLEQLIKLSLAPTGQNP